MHSVSEMFHFESGSTLALNIDFCHATVFHFPSYI
jgi:hypothetical protein